MEFYFFLILLIYFFSFFRFKQYGNNDRVFLKLSFILIFLFCALRDYTVGRDILGYMDVYNNSSLYEFGDFSWVYMEPGYVILMQICSYLGFSPRLYLFFIYALMTYPIYYFIKKYSVNYFLSTIIYICYQFLSFNLSGIRQGLATSICFMSLPYAFVNTKKDAVIFVSIVFLASTIHQSSLVYLALPFILKLRYNCITCGILIASMIVAPLFSQMFLDFVHQNNLSGTTNNSSLTLGGTLVFLILVALFINIACLIRNKSENFNNRDTFNVTHLALITLFSIFISLLFSGSMLLRSSMFYTLFLVLAIPKAIEMYPKKFQPFFVITFHIVMLLFFYFFCLVPKILDTVPYKFGSDLLF